jgi:hypothetical protein
MERIEMKRYLLLLNLLSLLTPIQGLCNDTHESTTREQGAWGQYYGAPIILRATTDTQQIELQFSEKEEFSLWKKSYDRLIRIPEGKEQIEIYNLADTGCNIEKKAFVNNSMNLWYLHSSDRNQDHCKHNETRIFKKDVTGSVHITVKENTPEIAIDPETLFQYQAGLPSNDRGDYYISSNHRFLILTPISLDRVYGEKPQALLPYAPELLLIDLESKKSHRIAFAGFESLSSITMDNNDLLLSFSNSFSNYTAFGDLWRLDLTDLSMIPIEGEQSQACGSASINMVRGRLVSSTSATTACGGNDGHHQAIFLNRSTLSTVYTDGLLGSDSNFSESYIATLFDTHYWYFPAKPIRADYQIVAEKNHIHLTAVPPTQAWPLKLSTALAGREPADAISNGTATLDAWLENNVLNIDIDATGPQEVNAIKLALHFDLADASNTTGKETNTHTEPAFLDIFYSIDTIKGSSLLINKAALSASGMPSTILELLEKKCCHYQKIKHNETEFTHHIEMDLMSYPVKSISGEAGLQISLIDEQGNELHSTRHTRHTSQQRGWNYFPNLTQLLQNGWGESSLANNIAHDNFNYAISLSDKLYLYNKTSAKFLGYQPPEVDEHKLQSLIAEWKAIDTDDMASFSSNTNIHKIYYRQIETGWRLYYLFNAGYATESGEYLMVTDYSSGGDFLQATAPIEIQFNCYRCDNASINYAESALYTPNNNQELIVIGGLQFLLNTDSFKWLFTEGTLNNTITHNTNADAAIPAELEDPSGNYGYITEEPFRIQSDKEINNELPILSQKPHVEPLSGIAFKDIYMEKCVAGFLKKTYPDNPTFDVSTIDSLDCSDFPTKDISDLTQFTHLKKLALTITPENNVEKVSAIKGLEELSLSGDAINLTKLKETAISTLTITTPTIDLSELHQLTHLKKLQLKSAEVINLTEDNSIYSNSIDELHYSGKKSGELLYHFPALKQVTLSHLDILASSCPASINIETLIIESITWKPVSAKCYPKLRQLSVKSHTESLLVDGPFLQLTQLTSEQFNKEIKEQAPALQSLTTGIILDMLPETIENLTMQASNRQAMCPGGNYLSSIKKAKLACNLLSQGNGNLPGIFANYDILENTANKANPHYLLKSVKVDLKNQASIKDIWPSYDEEKTKKDFATIESIEITGVSGTEFPALFADMPLLKSIKASSYNSYIDSSFIFKLPPLANLTSLSIGSFSRMDLSALEGSHVKELAIRAKEGQKTELTLNFGNLGNISSLDLGYGFTLAPSALPCSLTTVNAYYAGTPDESPHDCFAPTRMIINGTEVGAEFRIYQTLLNSTPATALYLSTASDSRIWKKVDIDGFFAKRPYLQNQKDNLISDCKLYNQNNAELHLLDYFRGACVIEKVAHSKGL